MSVKNLYMKYTGVHPFVRDRDTITDKWMTSYTCILLWPMTYAVFSRAERRVLKTGLMRNNGCREFSQALKQAPSLFLEKVWAERLLPALTGLGSSTETSYCTIS